MDYIPTMMPPPQDTPYRPLFTFIKMLTGKDLTVAQQDTIVVLAKAGNNGEREQC